jgi:hypothetical protein
VTDIVTTWDVDDVLQNTNAVLWQKRAQFKEGTNFLAWSFKIARYQVKHQHGRAKRDGLLVFSDQLVDQIAETAPVDQSRGRLLSALEGCLAKLTAEQRRRWGYRMLAVLMRRQDFADNLKRILRVYREEKLQVRIRRRRKTARWRGDKPVPASSGHNATSICFQR